jgi:AAA domain
LPEVTDPDLWRNECKSFGQLMKELPKFLIAGLVPAKALTAVCAPSYNCKTWFALAMAHAISTGKSLFGEFAGPEIPETLMPGPHGTGTKKRGKKRRRYWTWSNQAATEC